MAFTRKTLKAMGYTDEQVDGLIELHTEVTDALKADLTKYKTDAEKLPGVQKELDDLKAKGDGGFEKKYNEEHAALEKLKGEIAGKELSAKKSTAITAVLKEAGVSEKRIPAILRLYDMSKVELNDDGTLKDAETHKKTVTDDWSDYIETQKKTGTPPLNPPANNGGRKTKEEIMAIKDRAERRKEIAENMDLFEEGE